MKYRVDNVPLLIRPFYLLISFVFGLAYFLLLLCIHLTCRIRFEGTHYLTKRSNYIFCLWHHNWVLYAVTFIWHSRSHVWLSHPAFYMKPTQFAVRFIGIKKLLLGSEGEEGREAADKLVECLKQGNSTTLSPDGPAGPPKVLKKGVLHISKKSGVPIVPMRMSVSKCVRLKDWDAKKFPLPFSTITVEYGKPFLPLDENFDEATIALTDQLSSDDPE